MADAFLETTVWRHLDIPNHTYLLDGAKMVAYIPAGQTKAKYFNTPITIEKRGRQFTRLPVNPFTEASVAKSNLIEVAGSKGAIYYVDPDTKTCTCPGFSFRGKCKHLDQLV